MKLNNVILTITMLYFSYDINIYTKKNPKNNKNTKKEHNSETKIVHTNNYNYQLYIYNLL